MKRQRLLFAVILLLTVCLVFCSCNLKKNNSPTSLNEPTLSISEDGIASWKAVKNATGYIYKIDNVEEYTTDLTVKLEDGQSIQVKAVGDGKKYLDSQFTTVETYNAPKPQLEKLNTPVVSIDKNGLASWAEVENASGYVYVIDDNDETTITAISVQLSDGESINVKAIGDNENYLNSDYSVTQTYNAPKPEPVKLDAPVVSVDENGLAIWTAVANASGYAYIINNGEEQTTKEPSVQLSDGESIKVKAISGDENYLDSDYSAIVTYHAPIQPVKLATLIVNIDENGLATWLPLEPASGYSYIIDSKDEVIITTTSVQLSEGESIIVKAISGDENYLDSDYSASVTYHAPIQLPKLDAPVVNIDKNGLATWTAVENAISYTYVIDDGSENTINKLSIQLMDGESIKVKAVGDNENYSDSEYSKVKTYTTKPQPTKLATPVVSVDENGLATWTAVENAIGYIVKLNDIDYEYTKEQCEVSFDGDYILQVKALGDGENYLDSDFSVVASYTAPVPVKLDTPVVTVDKYGNASWTVENATTYQVILNGEDMGIDEITSLRLSDGETIQVKAIGDGESYLDSDFCDVVPYTKPIPEIKLDTPVVTVDEYGKASWEAIENAVTYQIFIDGEDYGYGNTLDIDLEYGYSIQVKAIGDGYDYADSDLSEVVTYNAPQIDPIKLDTPVVTVDENGNASWGAIENAVAYLLIIDGEELGEDNILDWDLDDGQSIQVKAIGDGKYYLDSDLSEIVTYDAPQIEPVKLATPVVTVDKNGNASWGAIENAVTYQIILSGTDMGNDNILDIDLDDGESIQVRAIGDGKYYLDSDLSVEVTYTAEKPDPSKLATPVVTVDKNGLASWQNDEHVVTYTLLLCGYEVEQAASYRQLTDGDTLKVKAIGDGVNYLDSDYSDEVTYIVEKPQPTKLATPVVTIDENGLASWELIENCKIYLCLINGSEIAAYNPYYQLSNGETIQVKALGDEENYTDSDYSEEVAYNAPHIDPVKLAIPVVTVDKNGKASWEIVENAVTYQIFIDGEDYGFGNVLDIDLEDGQSIQVKAIGDGNYYLDSDLSAEVTYTAEKPEPVKLAMPVVTVDKNGKASWMAVEHAVEYQIFIDGEELGNDNILDWDLEDGQSIQVKAIGDGIYYLDSDLSAEVGYIAEKPEPVKLATPVVTVDENGKASWQNDEYAVKYTLLLCGHEVEQVDSYIQLTDGDTLQVKAIGDGENYLDSEYSVEVIHTAEKPEPVKLATPVVTIDENGLATWELVENCKIYLCLVNGSEIPAYNPYYQLDNGETIQVKAMGDEENYLDSDYSKVQTYNRKIYTIKEVKESTVGKTYDISGLVVAVNGNVYVLTDNTDYIYVVSTGDAPKEGDNVTLTAELTSDIRLDEVSYTVNSSDNTVDKSGELALDADDFIELKEELYEYAYIQVSGLLTYDLTNQNRYVLHIDGNENATVYFEDNLSIDIGTGIVVTIKCFVISGFESEGDVYVIQNEIVEVPAETILSASLKGVDIDTSKVIATNTSITLPTANSYAYAVEFVYTLSETQNAYIANGVLVLEPTAESETLTLTLTAKYRSEVQTKEFTISQKKLVLSHLGTAEDPFTVADVNAIFSTMQKGDTYVDSDGNVITVYVTGVVLDKGTWSDQYGNYTGMVIGFDKDSIGTDQLYCYRVNHTSDSIAVFDTVVVSGTLNWYEQKDLQQLQNGTVISAETPEMPAEEVLELAIKLTEGMGGEYKYSEHVTLPTLDIDGLILNWVSDNEQIVVDTENNRLVITVNENEVTVKVTLTATYKDQSATKEITYTLQGVKNVTWEKVTDTSEIKVGDIIIIANSGETRALSIDQQPNNRKETELSIDNLSASVALIIVEEGTVDGTYALKVINGSSVGYLYAAGGKSSNLLKTKLEKDNKTDWDISINENGTASIVAHDSSITKNTLKYNASSNIFSCYASGQQDICIYKQVLTLAQLDKPTVTVSENGVASWEAIENACGYAYIINDNEEQTTNELFVQLVNGDRIQVKALGDNETARDSEYSAIALYTTKSDMEILESDLTFVEGMGGKLDKNTSIELPTPELEGLTYVWTSSNSEYITVDNENNCLVVTVTGELVTVEITLTATYGEATATKVITYTLQGEVVIPWEKVTNQSDFNVGDTIIIGNVEGTFAISTKQSTNNRAQANFNTEDVADNVALILVEEGTNPGTYALKVINGDGSSLGYLYAAGGTGDNNYLRTSEEKTAVTDWNITIFEDGAAKIVANDSTIARNTLMYNSGSSIFSCYASGQKEISVYKKGLSLAQLDKPTVTVSENGVASWEAIENACGYAYIINDNEEQTTNELYVQLVNGDRIQVKALGDNTTARDSEYSAIALYTTKSDKQILESALTFVEKMGGELDRNQVIELPTPELEGLTYTWVSNSEQIVVDNENNCLNIELGNEEANVSVTLTATYGNATITKDIIYKLQQYIEPDIVEMNIFASEGALAEDSNSITWTKDGFTVTGTKGTLAIRTEEENRFHCYQGSNFIIESINGNIITEVAITCLTNEYATILSKALTTEGTTATVNDSTVTVTVGSDADGLLIVFTNLSGQVRLSTVKISYISYSEESNVSVHFLELGNKYTGDCVLIKCGDVEVLIDAGSKQDSAATIKAYVDQYCTDGVLEYVIATHAHQDHIAGFVGTSTAPGIFKSYECKTIIDFPLTNATSVVYNNYVKERNAEVALGANHYTALECWNETNGAKRTYTLGEGVTLTILYNYFYDHETDDENNYSVCCLLDNNGTYSLFTGDLEKNGESYLVDYNDLPECKLFKGGHHGSYTASTDKLLSVIKPEIVCVCCCCGSTEYTTNIDNVFPSQAFIDRVTKYTTDIYVTSFVEDYQAGTVESLNGNIVVSFYKSGKVEVNCSNNNTKFTETDWYLTHRKK